MGARRPGGTLLYPLVQGLLLLAALLCAGVLGAATAAAAEDETATVSGKLVNAGESVPDVGIRALDPDGTEVASTSSAADGRFSFQVPLGMHTFEVVPETLPEGISVQGPVTRPVTAGRTNNVVFIFGEVRTGAATPLYERVIRLSIDGLRLGLTIAVAGVGLSLIFGTTGLTNFAHGELVTLGAVFAWMFNVTLGMPLLPAALIAVLVGLAIGWLNNAAIWRPLRKRRIGLIPQLVVSIGLALVLRYLVLIFFSDRTQAFSGYSVSAQRHWGPVAVTDITLITIAISTVVLIAVAVMLQKTRIGKAMRAVADNKDLAASSGINVERVITYVWCLGGGLAALGGVLLAVSELGGRVQWEMGFKLLLLMFAGITLGGLGTAYGALLGCVLVGLLVQLSTLVINPDLKYVGGLLILIVILIVRPQGILGSRERIG